MRVLDARSGNFVKVGQIVQYVDPGADHIGANWQLLNVERADLFGDAEIRILRLSDQTVHLVRCPVRWFLRGFFPVIVAPT